MKFNFTLIAMILTCMTLSLTAQESVMELKEKQAEVEGKQAELQAQVDAYQGELDGIASELEILGGWQTGLLGSVGFNLGSQSKWAGSANPNSSSSSLGIGLNGYANSVNEKNFWRNKGILTLGWQKVDPDTNDPTTGTGFDLNTDLLNLSSLYGKRLTDKWALSGLGEFNSSVGNFLDPGTLDIGIGATWTPSNDLVVVFHPINYHYAFSSGDGIESAGGLGCKIRADYTHEFPGGLGWSSTLTTFIPYVSNEPTLFEYTWLNNLTYTLAGGIGINLGLGFRNSEFESVKANGGVPTTADLQSYYNLGFSYAL